MRPPQGAFSEQERRRKRQDFSNASASESFSQATKAEKKAGFQQYVRLRESFPGKIGVEKSKIPTMRPPQNELE